MALGTWLAATKLTAPARRHDVLRRDRLLGGLRESLDRSRLTLVSAPAGAGKTTLLAELPHAFPEFHFCWLLLDTEDNDPTSFATALIASLQSVEFLRTDQELAPNEPRALITYVINRFAQSPDQRCALVLDDLHTITEPAVHKTLDYLLDHAPANLRVILATRHDPPLSLARRRARGEIKEIRLDDLSFTEAETGQLATECLGLNLNDEEVHLLHSRTEGWAAGLRLLATSLSHSPSGRNAVLQSGMQGSRRIFDFLAEEVLDQQPAELRQFLLETSILPRLRADVCNRVTGRKDSASVLEDLYRRNLYVVAADEHESSFRYHDLFADFLRERLRRERPDEWGALHLRAAQAENAASDRVRLLLVAEAWDEAAVVIEKIGPEYATRGFAVTLKRWIEALPAAVRNRHPRILYLLGQTVWTLTEFAEAQPYIEAALAAFRRANDHVGQSEALTALANSALMMNDLDKCRALLKEAMTYDLTPTSRVHLCAAAAWDAIYRQDWAEAMPYIDEVYERMEDRVAHSNTLATALSLFCEGIPGYLDKIEAVANRIQANLAPTEDLTTALFYQFRSAVKLHRGDFDGVLVDADRATEIAFRFGKVQLVTGSMFTSYAAVAGVRGDWAAMDHAAAQGCDDTRHGQIARNWRLHYLQFQARARLHSGDIEGLRKIYDMAMTPSPLDTPPTVAYRSEIRGMMRLAERQYAQAEQAFRDAMREEDGFQIPRAVASGRVMLAYTLLTRGRGDEAMEVLSPYLAESEQYNMPGRVMHHNPIIQPLLRYAHEHNIHRAFAEKVLDMFGAPLNVMEAAGGEALSDREMEVLRVMAEGLGNREIGARLFVSEATVKTHVQRILRKLDAATRTQAVTRARELMLI